MRIEELKQFYKKINWMDKKLIFIIIWKKIAILLFAFAGGIAVANLVRGVEFSKSLKNFAMVLLIACGVLLLIEIILLLTDKNFRKLVNGTRKRSFDLFPLYVYIKSTSYYIKRALNDQSYNGDTSIAMSKESEVEDLLKNIINIAR